MRFYWGLRLARRGIRPYLGVSLGSWKPGRHQAERREHIVYHCARCGAINKPTAKFCNKCGAAFTLPPRIER